jgi:hypothetical protein
MKPFKNIVVSKQPVEQIWVAVQDRMSEMASLLDDVERITVVSRDALADGRVRLVNEWRAKPRLPISIESITGTDAFIWLDHAEWNKHDHRCHWRIEPQFFPGRIHCHGVTHYESALGGRGSRITFEGELDLEAGALSGAGAFLERTVAPIVESVVTAMIPKNFRKIIEAAGRLVDQQS